MTKYPVAKPPEPRQPGAPQWPCTECGRDAMIAYSAAKGRDWNGKVKIGERLCTSCFRKRGGVNFFGR